MKYNSLVEQLNDNSASRIFTEDSMDWKKVRNAISKYAPSVDEDDVCLLIDDTVFGSAKAGILMTNTHLYAKEDFEDTFCISHENIKTLDFKLGIMGCDLLINGRKVKNFTQLDKSDLADIFVILKNYFENSDIEDIDDEEYEDDNDDEEFEDDIDAEEYEDEDDILTNISKSKLNFINADNVYKHLKKIKINQVSELEIMMTKGDSSSKYNLLKNILKEVIVTTTCRVRTEFFEAKGLKYFSNDYATKESLIINLTMLKLHLIKDGCSESQSLAILKEGLMEIFGKDSQAIINNIIECVNAIKTPATLVPGFFIRLYIGNVGKTPIDVIKDEDIALMLIEGNNFNSISNLIEEVTGNSENLGKIINLNREASTKILALLK